MAPDWDSQNLIKHIFYVTRFFENVTNWICRQTTTWFWPPRAENLSLLAQKGSKHVVCLSLSRSLFNNSAYNKHKCGNNSSERAAILNEFINFSPQFPLLRPARGKKCENFSQCSHATASGNWKFLACMWMHFMTPFFGHKFHAIFTHFCCAMCGGWYYFSLCVYCFMCRCLLHIAFKTYTERKWH